MPVMAASVRTITNRHVPDKCDHRQSCYSIRHNPEGAQKLSAFVVLHVRKATKL